MHDINHDVVVLIPGLGLGGLELSLLARRLKRRGYHVRVFRHVPWRGDLDKKALLLERFVARIEAKQVHFVGHSMGGTIVLHYLARHTSSRPGRVVVLGSPINGSVVAERLARLPLGMRILGPCMNQVRGELFRIPSNPRIGGIAGTMPIGVGRLFAVQSPSDGVVRVDEATHPDMSDKRVLPVSHMGLVMSRRVVELVFRFLQHGTFEHTERQVVASDSDRSEMGNVRKGTSSN